MIHETIMNKLERLKLYDVAAKKFIDKVNSGRAFSQETYQDLMAALTLNTDGTNPIPTFIQKDNESTN